MLKIAFRNIFRNKRRSFLTVISTMVGIMGVTVGLGWVYGVERMFTEEGKKLTGIVRVTASDFQLKEKSLDISSNISSEEIQKYLKDFKGTAIGRIKFGAMIFSHDKDERAMGVGIEKEDRKIIEFDNFIYEGRFLDFEKNGEIIIGSKVKEKLGLEIGESVTVLTFTQDRSISALNYKIVGFYKMDNGRLNRSFYITLKDAQYLLDMDGAVTEFLLYPEPEKDSEDYKKMLVSELGKNYLVKLWSEIGINEYMSSVFPVVKLIFTVILSLLSGIGITNTMMMVVFERRKEIGVLKSQGMRNSEIRNLFCLEGGLIGAFASMLGIVIGGTIVYYFSVKGIRLGEVLETVSDAMNIQSTIYMFFSWRLLIFAFLLGSIVSVFVTFITVTPEIKKEAVDNLRSR
ncbi:FtsX-like permease family protein [uncultured Ilyobacter sp.]|uniref:ABC transporter permease n=1 Tax=uncultured Ilyobacter sp. TaxID=544433 RepID=UPI0029F4D0CC|nr:FtsX-like permease family protein [uncultured Ilyobacter sp.]